MLKRTCPSLGLAAALALLAPVAASQVVISEIEFTPRSAEGQWIEIVNLGTTTVELTGWSLYLATATPSQPQNYWFGFPSGTSLASGKLLRVHWLAPVKASTATDIYTGNTVLHFLFGLFAEPLDPTRGALALMNTQLNNQVNDPKAILDWVSWGTTGFKRESNAISNGRWAAGTFAPPAVGTPTPTLAYSYVNSAGVHSGSDWMRDTTPTPGVENLGGAAATSYGTDCRLWLTAPIRLVATGVPLHGNLDFALAIDRDLLPDEAAVVALWGAHGDGSIKFLSCPIWLDLATLLPPVLVPKTGTKAKLPLAGVPQDTVAGLTLSWQWVVIDFANNRLGLTQGMDTKFGVK
jgi:hypothetical protein